MDENLSRGPNFRFVKKFMIRILIRVSILTEPDSLYRIQFGIKLKDLSIIRKKFTMENFNIPHTFVAYGGLNSHLALRFWWNSSQIFFADKIPWQLMRTGTQAHLFCAVFCIGFRYSDPWSQLMSKYQTLFEIILNANESCVNQLVSGKTVLMTAQTIYSLTRRPKAGTMPHYARLNYQSHG